MTGNRPAGLCAACLTAWRAWLGYRCTGIPLDTRPRLGVPQWQKDREVITWQQQFIARQCMTDFRPTVFLRGSTPGSSRCPQTNCPFEAASTDAMAAHAETHPNPDRDAHRAARAAGTERPSRDRNAA